MKFSLDGYSLYVLRQCLVTWQGLPNVCSNLLGFRPAEAACVMYFSYFEGLKPAYAFVFFLPFPFVMLQMM